MSARGKLSLVAIVMVWLAACSLPSKPESRLVGKWQQEGVSSKSSRPLTPDYQFEFFPDGTVVMKQRSLVTGGHFEQAGTGTYQFIDPSHLRVELGWPWGTMVYEVYWQD